MAASRQQIIESKEFLQLFNLPNRAQVQLVMGYIAGAPAPAIYDTWTFAIVIVSDAVSATINSGEIIIGCVSNDADLGGPTGIVQNILLIKPV